MDLSLTIDGSMPGVDIRPAKRLAEDGWDATTLSLYSHAGTHADAPRHFLPGGASLEDQDLSVCVGPARVIDLTPTEPRALIGPADVGPVAAGERLLLRTDWHRRYGTPAYRDELPRVSPELARELVTRGVRMIGVEPPSVADVNHLPEVTEVHRILLGGGVMIVEGLAHLDKLRCTDVEFIALPLKVRGGDGSPVRAVAIEEAHDG